MHSCVRAHAHTGSEAQSLVQQSSTTPTKIDLCGEGNRNLRIHQFGRKAAAAEWSERTPILGAQWADPGTCATIIQHLWNTAFLLCWCQLKVGGCFAYSVKQESGASKPS